MCTEQKATGQCMLERFQSATMGEAGPALHGE